MKRFILLLVTFTWVITLLAQTDLHVAPYFTKRFVRTHKANMVKLSGETLEGYPLEVFQSITTKLSTDEVTSLEKAIAMDTKNAEQQEAATKHGRLYYGFYQLKASTTLPYRRFLFYRNNGLQPMGTPTYTIIYMEGRTTLQELKRKFAP